METHPNDVNSKSCLWDGGGLCNFSSLYSSLSPKFSNDEYSISPDDKVFNFS